MRAHSSRRCDVLPKCVVLLQRPSATEAKRPSSAQSRRFSVSDRLAFRYRTSRVRCARYRSSGTSTTTIGPQTTGVSEGSTAIAATTRTIPKPPTSVQPKNHRHDQVAGRSAHRRAQATATGARRGPRTATPLLTARTTSLRSSMGRERSEERNCCRSGISRGVIALGMYVSCLLRASCRSRRRYRSCIKAAPDRR